MSKWTIASGTFSNDSERDLEVTEAGEMVYASTSLHDLKIQLESDNANFAFIVHHFAYVDLKYSIRARRADSDDYLSFSVDFENDTVQLSRTEAGTTTVLTSASHNFHTRDVRPYSIEFWVFDSSIFGIVNGQIVLTTVTDSEITSPGFSLYFPEINADDPPKFRVILVHELISQPDPTLEDDPSNLLVQFRKSLRTRLENPSALNWEKYKELKTGYDKGKNLGFRNETWHTAGYPLRRPSTEEFFSDD